MKQIGRKMLSGLLIASAAFSSAQTSPSNESPPPALRAAPSGNPKSTETSKKKAASSPATAPKKNIQKKREASCTWAENPEAIVALLSQRDALIELLGQSLRYLESLDAKTKAKGLKESEKYCRDLIEGRLRDSLLVLKENYSSYIPFLLWLGRYSIFKGDGETALKAFVKLTELKAQHIEANFLAAKLYLELGQKDKALEHLRRVVEIENFEATDKEFVIQSLRLLVTQLETVPSKVMEQAVRLQKMAGLDDLEKSRVVKLAIEHKLFKQAQEFLVKTKEPHRSLLELELLRAQADPSTKIMVLIAKLLNSPRAKALLKEEGIFKLIVEWIQTARSRKDWKQLRRASEFALAYKPSEKLFQEALEESLLNIERKAYSDLLRSVKFYPTSLLIQKLLIESLLLKELQKEKPSIALAENVLAQAELHADRFLVLAPDSSDAQFWKAYILSRKEVFQKSDLMFNALVQKLRQGGSLQQPVREFYVWLEAARVKKARGYFAEAEALLKEGIARTELEEDLNKLKAALATKPRQRK